MSIARPRRKESFPRLAFEAPSFSGGNSGKVTLETFEKLEKEVETLRSQNESLAGSFLDLQKEFENVRKEFSGLNKQVSNMRTKQGPQGKKGKDGKTVKTTVKCQVHSSLPPFSGFKLEDMKEGMVFAWSEKHGALIPQEIFEEN